MDRALHTDAIARACPSVAGVRYEARTRDQRGAGVRRLALARLATSQRDMLPPATLLPGLFATALDGNTARRWHTPLLIYQLAQVASARAR